MHQPCIFNYNCEEHARKDLIAAVFARGASTYDRVKYFWPMGRRLAEKAAIHPGARVLDVACGRGASLFPAAEQAGPTGQALGIDISAPMAEQTNTEAQRRGLPNAHALQMDAENLDFPDLRSITSCAASRSHSFPAWIARWPSSTGC